jgi:hypothetical protein
MNAKDGFPGYREHVIRNVGDGQHEYGLQPDGTFKVRGNLNDPNPPRQQAMKASHGKVMLHLLPPAALYDIARVREFGSAKYEPWDWTIGRNHTDYYDAIMRHALAWLTGEDNDPESGLPHMAHLACTAMFLLEFARSGKGLDNRPSGLLRNPMNEKR